jgi:hypothetical protein
MKMSKEYYAQLCPHEPSWVHDQLAEEREKLERENADLKRLLKRCGEKLTEECILHETHPIVKACADPLGTIAELKS